jgi:site-specific recombinase XerD
MFEKEVLEFTKSLELSKAIKQFLAKYLSPRTKKAYLGDIQGFVSWVGTVNLSDVTQEKIARYRDKLLGEKEPATVARKLTALRQFFSFCVTNNLLDRNPAEGILAPKVSNLSYTNGLTKEQAEALLRQPDKGTLIGKRDYAMLCLMIHNGLRRSELANIRWGDFSEERNYFVLKIRGKGGKEEVTKIKPKVMAAVEYYTIASGRQLEKDTPVFVGIDTNSVRYWNRLGKPMSTEAIRKMVKGYAVQAKIEQEISPHSLRHTCITLSLDGGASIRQAQYLARHSDPKMTIRYDRNRNNLDNHGTDYIRLDA